MEVAEREKQTIFQTYERLPIGEVLSASGSCIYTHDGERYLDAIAGLGVNALGHSDPALVLAIKQQAEKYPTMISNVRGKGFMIGVEIHAFAKQIAQDLLTEHHIIVNITGNEVIRLLPPLIWSEKEINEFLHGFECMLKDRRN